MYESYFIILDPRLNYYARYGQGDGPIHMTNLDCTGEEESLFDCPYDGADSHQYCRHYEDVSIECAGKCYTAILIASHYLLALWCVYRYTM